jgi:hypothetical protein
MKKNNKKKLALAKTTIRDLRAATLEIVVGGVVEKSGVLAVCPNIVPEI